MNHQSQGRGRQWRRRAIAAGFLLGTLALGLLSRHAANPIPFLRENAGDALWALAVFWGFALLFPTRTPLHLAALALAASFAIEISQLLQTPWLIQLRATRLGSLVLGHGFLWTDLLRYTVGVAFGWGIWSRIDRFTCNARPPAY